MTTQYNNMTKTSTIPNAGHRIKQINKRIKKQGIKKQWIAVMLGIDKSIVYKILNKKRTPKNLDEILTKIAEILR